MPISDKEIYSNQIHLRIEQFCVSQLVAREINGRFNLNIMEDHASRMVHMIARLWLPTQDLEEVKVRYPKDWWEAFKERWFPLWILKRWPVQYTQHVWKTHRIYPKLGIPGHARDTFTVATFDGRKVAAWQEETGEKTDEDRYHSPYPPPPRL